MGREAASARRLIFAAAAITLTWLALLATTYVVRFRFGARRVTSIAAIAICYAALAAVALGTVGFDIRGAFAAAGMLVPVLVAVALVVMR